MEVTEGVIAGLYGVIGEQLGVELDKIKPEAKFIEDLGADSLDTVELMMAIEDLIGCEIDDSFVEGFVTVGDVISFMKSN